ncbi:MAG: nucleoside-binding protein [Colwellia sp.]
MSVIKYAAILATVFLTSTVSAKQIWSDTSLSILQGSNYEVGDDERTVITFEHASGHSWGTTFTFFDRLHDNNLGGDEVYGEMSANITLFTPKEGFVKNLYFSPQVEFDSSSSGPGFNNYLYGVGVNLNVPMANFFNVTLFRRNNELYDDNNQLTIVWSFPLADGIVFDGFSDIVDSNDDAASQYNITSQLKYDIGQHIGVTKGHLYAGVEYTYWHNKFGIDGITENNANFLIKWHL